MWQTRHEPRIAAMISTCRSTIAPTRMVLIARTVAMRSANRATTPAVRAASTPNRLIGFAFLFFCGMVCGEDAWARWPLPTCGRRPDTPVSRRRLPSPGASGRAGRKDLTKTGYPRRAGGGADAPSRPAVGVWHGADDSTLICVNLRRRIFHADSGVRARAAGTAAEIGGVFSGKCAGLHSRTGPPAFAR